MTYDIVHRTTYAYSEPVTISHHAARMEPRSFGSQRCESFRLEITPEPDVRRVRRDYFGNSVCFFSVQQLHQELEVCARSRVTVLPRTPLNPAVSPEWEAVAALFEEPVSADVLDGYQFAFASPLLEKSPELAEYARQSFESGVPLLAGACDLTRRIHADFKYTPAATTVSTPLSEVLSTRCGVCQDFAHLGVAALRSIGLAARYVSGYLRTHAPPGKEKLVGADASHAWFSIFCPTVGWVDFDPTNNCMPGEEHITVAYGRDFADVSPLTGILTGGGKHSVTVGVTVSP